MKWTRPFSGACLQCKAGGNIYTIMNEKEGEYYLGVRPDKKSIRQKFETFRAMYKEIRNEEPEDSYLNAVKRRRSPDYILPEDEIKTMIRLLTICPFACSEDFRTFCRAGQDYAVDLRSKEIWPYWLPQRISPLCYKERECREWADEYLEERYGRVTLFDLI